MITDRFTCNGTLVSELLISNLEQVRAGASIAVWVMKLRISGGAFLFNQRKHCGVHQTAKSKRLLAVRDSGERHSVRENFC